MKAKHTALFQLSMLVLMANRGAFGQLASAPRTLAPVAAVSAGPTRIRIVSAPSGALIQDRGNNASLDLGRVSYFQGSSAPGESSQKNSTSFVVSTPFVLNVDCPGNSSSQVNVTMSRLDASPSQAILIDGTAVGSVAQTLVQSMRCNTGSQHRLDVQVPISTTAGSIGSTVAFVAMLNK